MKRVLTWQYKVLLSFSSKFSGDLNSYFFSCHGYLWWIGWFDATLNSAFQFFWDICLQSWETFFMHLPAHTHMQINMDWHVHTHTAALTVGRQYSWDQRNLLQHKPKPVSPPICPGSWTVYGCVKSVPHSYVADSRNRFRTISLSDI